MDVTVILSQIDAELTRLQQARSALIGINGGAASTTIAKRRGRPKGSTNAPQPVAKKRTMTPEGRARIAAAQKARWAATKKASVKPAEAMVPAKKAVAKKPTGKKALAKKTPTK